MRMDRGEALTEIVRAGDEGRGANLRGANLYGANLYGADLRGADLRGANLRGADLRGANLYGANLRGANLYGANLYGANLYGANLRGANLYGADLRGLFMDGLPSGSLVFIATKDGWSLSIGCWSGDLHDLEELLGAEDADWPEARGEERQRREKMLRPVLDLCKAYAGAHPDACAEAAAAAERWKKEDVS